MSKTDKALQAIRAAESAVDEELARHHAGAGTVSTPQQLSAIRQQLEVWEREITSGQVTPRHERNRGMGHMISDSWPLGSALGQVVLTAEEKYVAL